jgi:hypothetical protein
MSEHPNPFVDDLPWWCVHQNLVLLAHHLAEAGCGGQEVADAVEKPWKYRDEFDIAQMNATGES